LNLFPAFGFAESATVASLFCLVGPIPSIAFGPATESAIFIIWCLLWVYRPTFNFEKLAMLGIYLRSSE
jgi:hypothetical protein